jgi:AraC-like DNA-binding protein
MVRSNVFRRIFEVKPAAAASAPEKRGPFKAIILVIAAAGAVMFLLLLAKRKKTPDAVNPIMQSDFQKFIAYLDGHLADSDISAESVRKNLRFSQSYFSSLLKMENIGSIPKLINERRIFKARELLKDPKKNINEIGYEVGFTDPKYFSKVFKNLTNFTPSDFRAKEMG